MIYKGTFLFALLALFMACSSGPDFPSLDFLEGEWKVDGEERYEVWEKKGDYHMEGYGYIIDDASRNKVITENLSIKIDGDKLLYGATVPDQNEGETIHFTYNAAVTDRISFENLTHDFPKKIQYGTPKDGKMHIWLLGENDQGFDYDVIMQ